MSKKWLSSFTALLIALSLCLPHAGTVQGAEASAVSGDTAQALTDISGSWAEQTILNLVGLGAIKGYQDGTFKPNKSISRAEIVSVTNQLFSYTTATASTYKDVPAASWYSKEVGKAQQAGYISGYADGTFRPNQAITRQELAVMIAKLLKLAPSDSANRYTDTASSPSWSKGAIGAVIDGGVMTGYAGQTFKPAGNVTRAEAVTVLERAYNKLAVTYDQAGVYGPETGIEKITGNVVIDAAGITLRNVEISGNLLLGEGIGEGDVTLQNVKVHGTTTVRGGGENSIHFENSIMVTVVVDKASGKVRIVVNGATQIADVTIQSNAKLEAEAGAEINSVTLAKALPAQSNVQLVGAFESVNVIATNIVVDIPKGSIKEFNVSEQANGSTINVGKEAAIISLIMNAATSVLGEGKVQSATINAEGISMNKAPEQTKLGSNVPADTKVNVGGKDTVPGQTGPNAGTPGSGGSGGGNGGNGGVVDPSPGNPDPSPTPSPTPNPGGGNGGTTPLPTGPVPILSEVQYETTVGKSVYAISSLDGTLYIAESGTTRNTIVLEEAVKAGKAVKAAATANEGVYIDTTGLSKNKVSFIVVALSTGGQLSDPSYIKLYASADDALEFATTYSTPSTNSRIGLSFNKLIENNLTDLDALKAALTYSTDGVNFSPLAANDTILISTNELQVNFAIPYSGTNNQLKLEAGSIRDWSGKVYNQELISHPVKAGLKVTKMSYADRFKAGEPVTVRVNQPATVYLVRVAPFNTLYDVENEVVAGRGKKLAIAAADQDADIPTDGLAPGNYRVMIWAGNEFMITIE
ncbi:S-layer homology domain-containing protein [Paenibacillus sp. NPDC058071]|uniref:S-layer homology domain-containing protein n=1 Tax=Paenibacillus sp. NPDC058071 TaxID=3346326 RepID=UPI0036D7B8B1